MRRSSLHTRSVKCILYTSLFLDLDTLKMALLWLEKNNGSEISNTRYKNIVFFLFGTWTFKVSLQRCLMCSTFIPQNNVCSFVRLFKVHHLFCNQSFSLEISWKKKKTRTNENNVNSRLQSFWALCPVLTSWEKKILEGTGKVKSRTWGRKQVSSSTIYKINIGQISRFNSRVWYLLS